VAIAGSSIGAIMGAGMAAGMTGDDIHHYARSILGRRGEVARRIWRSRPFAFRDYAPSGFRLSQFNIEHILKAFLPEAVPDLFSELKIPLKVTATDYFGHRLAVFDDGDLLSALAASAAIPAVFRPVRREGRLLIDGGLYNPVPFDLLQGLADIVIAIDVVGVPSPGERGVPKSMDLIFGASQLMMQSIIEMKLAKCPPDVLIRPPVSRFRVLDFMKIETVMAETVAVKDELKRAVEAAVAAHERKQALAV
jgi:NTE family protein